MVVPNNSCYGTGGFAEPTSVITEAIFVTLYLIDKRRNFRKQELAKEKIQISVRKIVSFCEGPGTPVWVE